MDYKNRTEIAEQFKLACRGNFVDVIQDYCENHLTEEELKQLIPTGLSLGGHNFETVKYIMTNPKLQPYINIGIVESSLLRNAVRKDLHFVKFLLTSPGIKIHPDPCFDHQQALNDAAVEEKIDIVEYLLFSKELNKNCDLHESQDNLIKTCMRYQRSKVVDYLSQFYSDENLQAIYTELLNNQTIGSENPCFKKFKLHFNIRQEKMDLNEEVDVTSKKDNKLYKL